MDEHGRARAGCGDVDNLLDALVVQRHLVHRRKQADPAQPELADGAAYARHRFW
jgi:hypothetical protein